MLPFAAAPLTRVPGDEKGAGYESLQLKGLRQQTESLSRSLAGSERVTFGLKDMQVASRKESSVREVVSSASDMNVEL